MLRVTTGSELRFSGISGFYDNTLSEAVIEDLALRIYTRGGSLSLTPADRENA